MELEIIREPKSNANYSYYEKTRLFSDKEPKYTGFTPRPLEKLIHKKDPIRNIDHEYNHWVKTSLDNAPDYYPSIHYYMWKEVGKLPADEPDRFDENYNSNLWRNYTMIYGDEVEDNDEARKVNKRLADMYPVTIPKPSVLGPRTYASLLRDAPAIIKHDRQRNLVVQQTMMDTKTFRDLRLLDDARNPPLDKRGNLLPPPSFKRYPPIDLEGVKPEKQRPVKRIDLFGQPLPKFYPHKKHMLSYKVNNPIFDRVNTKLRQQKSFYNTRSAMRLEGRA